MKLIRASWPVKPTIHALTTTRMDGVSQPPYDGLNFAYHVVMIRYWLNRIVRYCNRRWA